MLIPLVQDSLDNLDSSRIRSALDADTYAVVRGLFDPEDVVAIRETIKRRFDATRDVKHDPRDVALAKSNLQKLVVGGSTSGAPRFVRKYYCPLFNEDEFKAHAVLKQLGEFRNLVYTRERSFALTEVEDGAWTCPMIAHYPAGGGFMAQHRDARAHQNAVEMGMDRFVQVILIMSEKGVDFHTGGAYIVVNGKPHFYEDDCIPGDVVIYDGRVEHGVEEIDINRPLKLDSPEGRYVAMVPLFRELNSFSELREIEIRSVTRQ